MFKFLLKILTITLCFFVLTACVTSKGYSPAVTSHLQQGQRYFEDGYYKRAMDELLPLACDGNAEAQYAVGYMYYYGYGVAQDTDVGYFWIKRSANQHYAPAIKALDMISKEKDKKFKTKDLLNKN